MNFLDLNNSIVLKKYYEFFSFQQLHQHQTQHLSSHGSRWIFCICTYCRISNSSILFFDELSFQKVKLEKGRGEHAFLLHNSIDRIADLYSLCYIVTLALLCTNLIFSCYKEPEIMKHDGNTSHWGDILAGWSLGTRAGSGCDVNNQQSRQLLQTHRGRGSFSKIINIAFLSISSILPKLWM